MARASRARLVQISLWRESLVGLSTAGPGTIGGWPEFRLPISPGRSTANIPHQWGITRSVDVSRETSASPGEHDQNALLHPETEAVADLSEQRAFCRYAHSSGIPLTAGLDLNQYLVAESVQIAMPRRGLEPQLSKPFGDPTTWVSATRRLRDNGSTTHSQ